MRMQAGVDQFLLEQNFPPNSLRWYRQKLYAFASYLDAQGIDFESITHLHVSAYLRTLQERDSVQFGRPLSTKTLHGYARAIKAMANWAHVEDYLVADVGRKMRMPKQDETLVEVLSPEELGKLFKACQKEPGWLAERDATILSTLLDTGIRASECTGLRLEDVQIGLADSYLTVLGKGRRMREVPLGVKCRSKLHRYVHKERPTFTQQWLFPSRRGTRLTLMGLDKTLYRLRDYAGLDATVRAHVFRHTMAVMFIENGGDVLRLSRILGHSSLAVTQEYLKQFTSRQARAGALSVFDAL